MAGMTVSRPTVPVSPVHALAPPTLGQVLEVVQGLWPRELAEPWDAVGPVAGRPEAPVRTVLWALDPVQAVADEAVARGADLVVTHHPLLLRGTSSVAAVGHAAAAKGRLLHTLIEHRIALLAAHTNADVVVDGVSDVLARAVGVTGALSPLTTSAAGTGAEGIGRVGDLPEETDLAAFARAVHAALPATAGGVRVAGDPAQRIRRVAVCGGAGDSLFDAVRASGADVYVTADLRHHPASEARETAAPGEGRPALVDVSHWASESLWLEHGARALEAALAERGLGVTTLFSDHRSDPWDFLVGGERADEGSHA
ncbi:dinuclear metal center YbgI/SA1388 family protein [Micrococcus sp. KT16]|nr:dinuclear metal center YbgI/SA1388 family protein [Micrococcus sp. KT16]